MTTPAIEAAPRPFELGDEIARAEWNYDEAYIRWSRAVVRRHVPAVARRRRAMWTCTALEILLAAGAWTLLARGGLSDDARRAALVVGVAATLSAPIFPVAMAIAGTRWLRGMRDPRRLGARMSMVFAEKGLEHAGPTSAGRLLWSSFEDSFLAPDALLLRFAGAGGTVVVPLRSLAPRDALPRLASLVRELRSRAPAAG